MELFFGALTALIVELHKRYMKEFSQELTRDMILVGVFVLVLVWTVLTQVNIITPHTVLFIGEVFTISFGIYEVVIKRLINPLLKKLFPTTKKR